MSRNENLAASRIARRQSGLLVPSDLAEVTGRQEAWRAEVRSGRLRHVLPGVLAPASVEVTPRLLASAAMLWDTTALLSHHEAAEREGIWVPDADRLRVTVPFTSKKRSLRDLEVVRSRVTGRTYRTDGFHRWTPAARTVVDLAQVLTRRQLEAVLMSAVRTKATTAAEVEATLTRLASRRGQSDLRSVLRLWSPERESFLENVLYGDVSAVTDEEVVRQHRLADSSGRVVARIDIAIPRLRLAFEADGLAFHSTDEQIAADQRRDRTVLAFGWPTVRFREGTLDERARVRREVSAVIRRRTQELRAA